MFSHEFERLNIEKVNGEIMLEFHSIFFVIVKYLLEEYHQIVRQLKNGLTAIEIYL